MRAASATRTKPPRLSRRVGMVLLRAAISGGLLALLLAWFSSTRILDVLRQIPLSVGGLVVVLFLLGHVFSAMKWRMLVSGAGAPIGGWVALRAHAAGLFANLCLPSIIGGDVVRAGLAVRAAGRVEAVALGTLADRLIDTTALVGIAGVAAVLSPELARGRAGTALVAAGILLLLAVLGGVAVTRWVPAGRLPERLRQPAARVRAALDALARVPLWTGTALGVSVFVQGAFVGLNVALARGIGIDLPFLAWLLAWPLAKLVALLPISLGGIGVREVALAAFLSPFGIEPALAVAQSLAWEAVLVTGGSVAGVAALVLGGTLLRHHEGVE